MKQFNKEFYKHLKNKEYWLYLLDVILRKPNASQGFIPYEPKGKDEIHYRGKEEVLGNTKKVLNEGGKGDFWTKYRPIGELQRRGGGQDKMACVTFSAKNALEEILIRLDNLVKEGKADDEQKEIVKIFRHFEILKDGNADCSDRYIAKLSGTTYRGNSQAKVADAIRHYGLVAEKYYPWVEPWSEYYQAVPQSVIDKGKALLEYIEFNYEWAGTGLFRNSLQYAPLQTSGYAWGNPVNGLYPYTSYTRNHAFVRDGFTNEYIEAFDSYEPFGKKLANNFSFGWDMIFTIHLKKKLNGFNQAEINKLRNRGLKYVMRPLANGELYELTDNGLKLLNATEARDIGLRTLETRGDFVGISEELF